MNWLDYVLIAVIAISAIAGLIRGLLHELLSLVTWIAAIWLAWAFAPAVEPYLNTLTLAAEVRPWIARGAIFLGVLLIGALISAVASYFVRLSVFGGLDRLLGAVFGMLRGLLIIGVLVVLGHALQLQHEPWWRRSLLVPYAEHGTNELRGWVGAGRIALNSPLGPLR